jgi:predicted AAA+ superfamily ATPase
MTPDKMNYIFLDEIQHVKQYEKAVDSLFVKKNADVYITGSNAYFMSGELATLLSGRYVELKMLPLSFKEYASAFDESMSRE